MRGGRGATRLAGMNTPSRRCLTIEATIEGSTIRGMLSTESGARREFYGWLEFNTAVEAALRNARVGDPYGVQQPSRLGCEDER
jgi:hypothetical protein